MLTQFFKELSLPGCVIQVGNETTVHESLAFPTASAVEDILTKYRDGNNLFVLGGVKNDLSRKYVRARDEDVIKKNYFYLDLDIRKNHKDTVFTDEQIKTETLNWVRDTLGAGSETLKNWRYIVYTGNGLHIYYMGDAIEIPDKEIWSKGLNSLIDEVENAFGEEFDRACVNPSRIARMPGSLNHKSKPPKASEILAFQDKKVPLFEILQRGQRVLVSSAEEAKRQADAVREQFPDKDIVYEAIQKIPVGKVFCMLTGFVIEPDGIHFSEAHKRDRKGCFISDKGNYIISGGTSHLPKTKEGYSTFELVKAYKNYDNSQTFFWFKNNFPDIKRLSDGKIMGLGDVPPDYDIKTIFKELRTNEVHQLNLGGHWDEWRLLLRGKVTRIGAMPGTGKSKMGYFLANRLIKEYKGLFFSTEVSSSDVLAHMLQLRMKQPYLDILERRVEVPLEIEESFQNIKVFDVRHTGNQLTRMEQLIRRECDRAEAKDMRGLDFIVVDWSQQVTPKSGRYTDIFTWATEWGNQCQEIAQKYDICFIDITQLSVKGNKDEDEKFGHVPYEGGNKLVQTADIASMMSRDKSLSQNNQVTWDIRKSKAMGRRFRLEMEYEWNTGEFTLTSAVDSRTDSAGGGYHNYKNL